MADFQWELWLSNQQQRVETLLRQRILEWKGPETLVKAVEYSLMAGGKRLRPILCLAFAEIGRQSGVAVNCVEDAACAIEFIHTYSLIHDDLPAMDNADLRRGILTNHKKFGEAMAILAGDTLLTDAFAVLSHSKAPDDASIRSQLVQELAVAAGSSGMVGGQVLDVAPLRPRDVEELMQLHRMKTGALIRASCRMGAIAGQSSKYDVEIAGKYGAAVGLAFQIADDILDVTSDASTLGKNVQVDVGLGKVTFPSLIGLAPSKELAKQCAADAAQLVRTFEPHGGPLTALAHYCVERVL